MHVENCGNTAGVVGKLLDRNRRRRDWMGQSVPAYLGVERQAKEALCRKGVEHVPGEAIDALVPVGDPARNRGDDVGGNPRGRGCERRGSQVGT